MNSPLPFKEADHHSARVHHFAYLFERFPRFEQTFCWREVKEQERLGLRPLVFSLRDPRDQEPPRFPADWYDQVHYLPPADVLAAQAREAKATHRLARPLAVALNHWRGRPDKGRVYEAAWIGEKMREAGVRHLHAHFAGSAARAAWWLHWAYGFTYSFTGHANDIFVEDPALSLTLARLVADARFVAVESRFAQAYLQQRYPRHADKIHVVYNGLDVDALAVERKEALAPPLILSVGRLIEKKGFPMLIDACALLQQRGAAFRCEIIGDGPLREALTALIQERGLTGVVALTGPASMEEVTRRLATTRVFALACAREADGGMDNLPTVIMEAMAARVPCVSTRLAGVPEMVEEGITGMLVNEGDTEGFAEALSTLLADAPRARQMGEAGQARARRLFSTEVNGRRLLGHFVSQGQVAFEAALVRRHPSLALAYAKQLPVRLASLSRRKSRDETPPDFLAAASSRNES